VDRGVSKSLAFKSGVFRIILMIVTPIMITASTKQVRKIRIAFFHHLCLEDLFFCLFCCFFSSFNACSRCFRPFLEVYSIVIYTDYLYIYNSPVFKEFYKIYIDMYYFLMIVPVSSSIINFLSYCSVLLLFFELLSH